MKKLIIVIAAISTMAAAHPAMAGDGSHSMKGHMHGTMHDDMEGHDQMKDGMDDMKEHGHMKGDMGNMKEMFLVKKEIDGYTVSYHAMKAKPGKEMGGSHNFMIKVEKDSATVTGLTANSKVVHPNGKSESKMMMKMGDWYMAGYDLDHHGQHQLMVLFKTADGAKHFGGVNYPRENH